MPDFPLGVYEKALPSFAEWGATFEAVSTAGFASLDLAIDGSAERLLRLDWSDKERRRVREAATRHGVAISCVTLSAHRLWPWGSADSSVREHAGLLADQAIGLAADLQAPAVQIAGYFTYDEPSHPAGRDYFLSGLARAAAKAEQRGVTLALENVDGRDILDVTTGLGILEAIGSPNLKLYVDVGNLAGNSVDVLGQLRLAREQTFAVQFKDATPGVFRRVPFGEGIVPFQEVLRELATWASPSISLEMWNDDGDPQMAAEARDWFVTTCAAAGVSSSFS